MQDVLVAERYRLIRPVGRGGMGRVWLARDETLRREVAIKQVVRPEWMTPDEADELEARIMREAQATARLNHPNVVQVFDVVHAGSTPWIVMEYVPSRSLQEIIALDGPMPPGRVAWIGLKVLAALRAAHDSGVLHRDVKPHNVLVGDDGRVMLTDFGLAFVDDAESAITQAGMVMGSPQYVAPERARDGLSTVEADLWSLGATLYAGVEGRSPYARSTTLDTLTALATATPDPPKRAGALQPVLDGLLERSPQRRLTAAAVEPLLRRAAESDPPRATMGGRRFGPRRYVLLASAVVVAAAGVAVGIDRLRHDPAARGGTAVTADASASAAPCTRPPAAAETVTPGPIPLGELDPVPEGWTWYADPAGFRLTVPLGWKRFREGNRVCFSDSAADRAFAVEPGPLSMTDAASYWSREEQRLTSAGQLPGYRRLTLGRSGFSLYPVWEYRWVAGGRAVQVMRLVDRTNGHTYLLTWRTGESDWSQSLVSFGRLRASVEATP